MTPQLCHKGISELMTRKIFEASNDGWTMLKTAYFQSDTYTDKKSNKFCNTK
ncbi:hypothetical protein CHS0354_025147, partial [Potamilus streckersoni]